MLQPQKSLLIAAGLVASLTAYPVLAQEAAPPQDPPAAEDGTTQHSLFDALEAQLKLTEEQKPQVHPIFVAADAEIRAVLGNAELSTEEKQQQVGKIVQGLPEKVNPFLDETQKATLAAFVAHSTAQPDQQPEQQPEQPEQPEQPDNQQPDQQPGQQPDEQQPEQQPDQPDNQQPDNQQPEQQPDQG